MAGISVLAVAAAGGCQRHLMSAYTHPSLRREKPLLGGTRCHDGEVAPLDWPLRNQVGVERVLVGAVVVDRSLDAKIVVPGQG